MLDVPRAGGILKQARRCSSFLLRYERMTLRKNWGSRVVGSWIGDSNLLFATGRNWLRLVIASAAIWPVFKPAALIITRGESQTANHL